MDERLAGVSPELQTEFESSNTAIWRNEQVEIIIPAEQAIDPSEGTQVSVQPSAEGHSRPWTEQTIAEIAREAYFALPMAKIIAESGRTPDLWANIHWSSLPNHDRGANVFGRRPDSEIGWAKPVILRSGNPGVGAEQRLSLAKFAGRYLPRWETFQEEVQPFRDGVQALSPESEAYQQEAAYYAAKPEPWQETVVWANERFVIVSVDNPHVSGLHLVAHPRDSHWAEVGKFQKPWQTDRAYQDGDPNFLEGFVEAACLLKAAQELLSGQSEVPFFNPEIHFSGNWAKDLQPQERGGRIDTAGFAAAAMESDSALRAEKRQYHNEATRVGTAMHGHLYATSDPGARVALPSRPAVEVPEEWEGIQRMSESQVAYVQELLQALPEQLEAGLADTDQS